MVSTVLDMLHYWSYPAIVLNLQWPRREVKFPGMDLGVIRMQEAVKIMREEEFPNRMIYISLLIYNVVLVCMLSLHGRQIVCVCVRMRTRTRTRTCKDARTLCARALCDILYPSE